MVYADYDFYSETYLGAAIAQSDFSRLAQQASAQIDALTYNRAAAVVEADDNADVIANIKNATCAVAETLMQIERAEGGEAIASERIGEHSVTYVQGYSVKLAPEQRLKAAAKTYLGLTGLMYAGVDE